MAWRSLSPSAASDWLDNGSVLEGSLPPAKAVPKLSGIASPAMIAIFTTTISVKWAAILLEALCALIAIAMVHSDNRLTCAIALTLFATGVAICVLMIAAYTRPFTGEISVGPDLLQQVITSETASGASAH
jgi:hypothetical protein